MRWGPRSVHLWVKPVGLSCGFDAADSLPKRRRHTQAGSNLRCTGFTMLLHLQWSGRVRVRRFDPLWSGHSFANRRFIYGGIEAYRFQEAFQTGPGPSRRQKRTKTDQKHQQSTNMRFCWISGRICRPYFSNWGGSLSGSSLFFQWGPLETRLVATSAQGRSRCIPFRVYGCGLGPRKI